MLESIVNNLKIDPSSRELDHNFMIGLIITIILSTIINSFYVRN